MKNDLLKQLKAEVAEEFRKEFFSVLKEEFIDDLKDAVRAELYDELRGADLQRFRTEAWQEFYEAEYSKIEEKVRERILNLDEVCAAAFAAGRRLLEQRYEARFRELELKIEKEIEARIARLVEVELTEKIRGIIVEELLKGFKHGSSGQPDGKSDA